MAKPPTQFTGVGDISIAYQVVGDGLIDLVYAQGWLTNIDYAWNKSAICGLPGQARAFQQTDFFDKRGTGSPREMSAFLRLSRARRTLLRF